MKTIDQHFADWEGHAFGYGYGTGEQHIMPALAKFLEAVPEKGTYDYRELEIKVGPAVAWLLINILCAEDIIEYGTSPRFGWLTLEGQRLREYLLRNDICNLMGVTAPIGDGYVHCYPDNCNCVDGPCVNPFWPPRTDFMAPTLSLVK